MNIHLAKRKTASVRIEIEQITASRFERRNTGICVKSAVRTFFVVGENERLAEQARADREEVERLKEELRRLKERPDRESGPNDSEQ